PRGLQPDPNAGVEIPWHCVGRRRRGRPRAHQSRDACLRLHLKRWLRDLDEKVASWEPLARGSAIGETASGPVTSPGDERPTPSWTSAREVQEKRDDTDPDGGRRSRPGDGRGNTGLTGSR